MNNIKIITGTFYNELKQTVQIGGVETYIRNLSGFLMKEGYEITVYQFSKEKFQMDIDNIKVIGTGIPRSVPVKRNIKKIINLVTNESELDSDILLFATDGLVVKNKFKHSIAIQHGIDWDVLKTYKVSNLENIFAVLKSISKNLKVYLRVSKCKSLVCVDYNFLNWYRAHIKSINNRLYVIPNFADIVTFNDKKQNDEISIIFARRFVEYRGTKLFAEAIEYILRNNSNIRVTFAGEGPDEKWLKDRFEGQSNVDFIKFAPSESINIHRQFDIAVVPTIGSEGTSLSLLEAMSAGCAVIASNVGGMTNIILDEYNGLIIHPDKEQLVSALECLINDKKFREILSKNAVETVAAAFSKEKWEKKWKEVFCDITR